MMKNKILLDLQFLFGFLFIFSILSLYGPKDGPVAEISLLLEIESLLVSGFSAICCILVMIFLQTLKDKVQIKES